MGRASQSHRPVGNRIRARIRAETGSLLATDQGASREGIRGTNEHRVQATVSRGRLLVYDIRQGWGPLCDFLECPTPTVDFPNLNDRELLESMPEAVASGDSSLAAKWGKGLQAPKIRTGEGA